jgi:hypothetical protein
MVQAALLLLPLGGFLIPLLQLESSLQVPGAPPPTLSQFLSDGITFTAGRIIMDSIPVDPSSKQTLQ